MGILVPKHGNQNNFCNGIILVVIITIRLIVIIAILFIVIIAILFIVITIKTILHAFRRSCHD